MGRIRSTDRARRGSTATGLRRAGTLPGLLALLLATAFAADAEELLVASAMSLREPVIAISERYERQARGDRIVTTFGASSILAAQIRAGAPVDVFLSADARIVAALIADKMAAQADAFPFAANRLVVIRSAATHNRESDPAQLFSAEVDRIAIPNPAVPVGRYAREWLQSKGLLAQLADRIVESEHARATLSAVELGHAALAIVYATDARLARSARVAYEIPAEEQPEIIYSALRLRPSQLADDFLSFLRGEVGRSQLIAAGFQLTTAPEPAQELEQAAGAAE